jgi:hypothetical protein
MVNIGGKVKTQMRVFEISFLGNTPSQFDSFTTTRKSQSFYQVAAFFIVVRVGNAWSKQAEAMT